LGDLRRARLPCDNGQIGNADKHLKIKRHDVKVRRVVIVGVDPQADISNPMQDRHGRPSHKSATIAL
jgi:acetaldehyde dehydrogenase (acetylating)